MAPAIPLVSTMNKTIVRSTKKPITSHLNNFRLIMADAGEEFRKGPPRSGLLVMRMELGDGGMSGYAR